ncbi:MAG: hypothetical protein AVDCRST_MAG56-476, partial [uncultured Cytophagales bacterium]
WQTGSPRRRRSRAPSSPPTASSATPCRSRIWPPCLRPPS